MSESATTSAPKTPWHIWVVGILTFLWNSVGVMDFVMINARNAKYLAELTPEQLTFVQAFPMWVTVSWATAVFGAVLGSLLILMRKAIAVPVFVLAMAGLLVTSFHNFVLKDGMKTMGGVAMGITVAIFVIAIFLAYYSHAMKKKGLLR